MRGAPMNTSVIDMSKAKETREVATSDTAALIQVIERAARDPNIDIDKMERLLAMQERIVARASEAEFNAAMTRAQAEMGRISADATNPETHSKYASYAKLDKVLRPIYTTHGFALSFDEGPPSVPGNVRVLCHVSHAAGHTRTYAKELPADGKGPKGGAVMTLTHAAGAAMTYAMRYLLKGIFNVAVGENDNDGNGAVPLITEGQAADLEALITEVKADKGRFLRYCKITSLSQIPAANYSTVVKMLEAKRARR